MSETLSPGLHCLARLRETAGPARLVGGPTFTLCCVNRSPGQNLAQPYYWRQFKRALSPLHAGTLTVKYAHALTIQQDAGGRPLDERNADSRNATRRT